MYPYAIVVAGLLLCAPVPRTRSKATQIDLSGVYTTFEMKAPNSAKDVSPEFNRDDLKGVHSAAGRIGLPCATLVAGKDFKEVIRATNRVFGSGIGGDVIVQGTGDGRTLWLMAFLGNHSSTPAKYSVQRVEVDGRTVRLVYGKSRNPLRLFHSCDHYPYLLWVNLDVLEAGAYKVELVDADSDEDVVASRKVVVKKVDK